MPNSENLGYFDSKLNKWLSKIDANGKIIDLNYTDVYVAGKNTIDAFQEASDLVTYIFCLLFFFTFVLNYFCYHTS